jgi:pimeloyl-ACP methyl ester carboxylesterase
MKITLTAVLCAGLLSSPSLMLASSAAADPASGPTTYVIVHGAWGGGWAFRKVDALLTARGHKVYRPTLTGLGERVHLASTEVGLSTHVNDVVNLILFEELRDVVLLGHSYGGMVISGVAQKVPDRIRRLVYLDAFVPEHGESVMTASPGREGRSSFLGRMTKDGFVVPPWVKAEQPVPKDVPHPLKTFTETIALENEAARRLPTTYILTIEAGAEVDDFSPYAERAKARGWDVRRLQADHNPQWSAPEALVEMLHEAR